jgi:hypothetical protein
MIIKNYIHDVVAVETNVAVLPFEAILAYAIIWYSLVKSR